MENNENFVTTEEVTENAEQTAEETPKMYSEDELNARVNEIVGKRVARKEAKIRREYDRKYGELESVLRAGTGMESVDEMTDMFTEHYEQKGVKLPGKAEYSDADIAVLANAEADEIIRGGSEEVVEELERLKEIGVPGMTAREKAVFKRLADHLKATEDERELASIGVTKEVYESADFKDFAKKFVQGTHIKDIYNIYSKTQPKKEITTMGSMKNTTGEDNGVKDFYSLEEASKFTRSDFEKNPGLFKAVKASMPKW